VRRSAALLLALSLTVTAAACGDDEADEATSDTTEASDDTVPGAACAPDEATDDAADTTEAAPVELASSDLGDIDVSGEEGEEPVLDFPQAFGVEETERLVLTEGEGDEVAAGTTVSFHFLFVNGRDGCVIESSYAGDPAQVPFADDLLAGVFTGLEGLTPGSQAITAIAPVDGLGEDPTVGLLADDTLLFLVDVLDVRTPLARAEGEPVTPPEGLPTVVLDETGAPTITLPGGEPPTDLVTQVLIQGTGPAVETDQTITAHYTGVKWADGSVFDSSWERGSAASFPIAPGSVIDGWVQGLTGQAVGSQVLLVIPPALAYPEGTGDGSITGEDTLVFVVDILDAS
jgi:peptidylprolyl isomerase